MSLNAVCHFIIGGSAATDQTKSGLMNNWLSWVRLADGSSQEGHHFYLSCSTYCYDRLLGPIDIAKDPWTQFSWVLWADGRFSPWDRLNVQIVQCPASSSALCVYVTIVISWKIWIWATGPQHSKFKDKAMCHCLMSLYSNLIFVKELRSWLFIIYFWHQVDIC